MPDREGAAAAEQEAAGAEQTGDRVDLVVYDEDDRRYVPARLVLVLAALTALLAVGVVVLALRSGDDAQVPPEQASAPVSGVSAPQAGVRGDTCTDALARGDAALERASKLRSHLEAHTRVLDDLLAKRATADQVVERSLPVLTEASTDRQRFAEALAAYERERRSCAAAGTG